MPVSSRVPRPLPQWSEVHRELRGKGVTLALLWQEYKAVHPQGLQYSRFCEQYRAWASTLDVVMRFEHRAGENMFVDYAGLTVAVVDPHTGEIREASRACSPPRAPCKVRRVSCPRHHLRSDTLLYVSVRGRKILFLLHFP